MFLQPLQCSPLGLLTIMLYSESGNTSDEEKLLIDKVEVRSYLRLDCVILSLLAPLFFYSLLQMSLMCSVKLSLSSMFTPRILKLAVGLSF